MKKALILFLLGFIYLINNTYAVTPTSPHSLEEVQSKDLKQEKKAATKQARLEKRLVKVKKKLQKKGIGQRTGIWDNDTFRLGALIALGGLALRLLAFLPFLGGLLSLIGTLILLIGIGIMIWVLIED